MVLSAQLQCVPALWKIAPSSIKVIANGAQGPSLPRFQATSDAMAARNVTIEVASSSVKKPSGSLSGTLGFVNHVNAHATAPAIKSEATTRPRRNASALTARSNACPARSAAARLVIRV